MKKGKEEEQAERGRENIDGFSSSDWISSPFIEMGTSYSRY